jgi:hypothetical protein
MIRLRKEVKKGAGVAMLYHLSNRARLTQGTRADGPGS